MSTPAQSPTATEGAIPGMPPEPPRRGWWMTKRFLAGALLIVLAAGGVSYQLARHEVSKIVEALGESRRVQISSRLLAPTSKGQPQTLLLVGNDQRPAPKNNPNGFVIPHSNEMLLVRIDPSKPTISMLSIPRELRVTIYPHNAQPVSTRINAAYGIGGAELMTETIKRVLGVSVNHVFVLTFPKFRRAVDELGCVYMGVDRRYYHVNEPGGEQYFEINLQPGYQRLCGKQALEFVANRHEDTSLTRDARDQRFLLEVKAQYGANLFAERDKFERILGRTVETDLHSESGVLDLLELLLESEGKPVRQVPFNVNLLSSYDTASPRQIHESVRSFLNGTAPIRKPKVAPAAHSESHHHHHHSSGVLLAPSTTEELEHARSAAPSLPFALEYPRGRDTFAGSLPDTLRVYDIRDQRGHPHPIYAVVIDRGELGQFYDVQGTNWSDPPILNDPGQVIHVGQRDYELFYAGEAVRAIAWREDGAVYWIQNTLTDDVSPRAMLAMAEQTLPVFHIVGHPAAQSPADVNLAPHTSSTSVPVKIAALLGLLGLALLVVAAASVLARRRELRLLREQVAQALAIEARQRPMFAAAGVPYPESQEPSTATARVREPTPRRKRRAVRLGRRALLGAVAVAVGVAAVLAIHFSGGGSSRHPLAERQLAVAVFNATQVPGAAHDTAAALRARRVHVARVGDINASLGHGTFVLYPRGAQTQARRLAALLSSATPTVQAIQPQLQEAVGRRNEIVIVLD